MDVEMEQEDLDNPEGYETYSEEDLSDDEEELH